MAGHIECGAQSSGGNLLRDWRRRRARPGFRSSGLADGTFVVTASKTGGIVNVPSVTGSWSTMGDRTLHHAGWRRGFTTIQLKQAGRIECR